MRLHQSALALLIIAASCGQQPSTPAVASDQAFQAGEPLELTGLSESDQKIEVGFDFEVGALESDFFPGDVECEVGAGLTGLRVEPVDEISTSLIDGRDFTPIATLTVDGGSGILTCYHYVNRQVTLRALVLGD